MRDIKKLKNVVLFFIGIVTFQAAFSQENYISGYVIKTNADTLYG